MSQEVNRAITVLELDESQFIGAGDTVNKETKTMTDGFSLATKELKGLFIGIGGAFTLDAVIGTLTEFDSEIANTNTLLNDFDISIIEDQIIDLAGPLGNVTELTKGAYAALSAGQKPAEVVAFIGQTAKLAKAGLIEMGDTINVVTTAINAYGLESSETQRVTDLLFSTIALGKTTGTELAASLGAVIPTAVALGIPLEQVTSAVATLTTAGLTTAAATTALNATFAAIIGPTDGAKKAAEKYGIELSGNAIEAAGGLQQYLADLGETLGDNKEAYTELFPSVEAFRAVSSLATTQSGKFKEVLDAQNNSLGAVDEGFRKQSESISGIFTGLFNSIQASLVKILLPALRDFAGFIGDNSDSIIGFFNGIFEALGLATSIIGGFIEGVSGIFSAFSTIIDIIPTVINFFTTLFSDIISGFAELPGVSGFFTALSESFSDIGSIASGFVEGIGDVVEVFSDLIAQVPFLSDFFAGFFSTIGSIGSVIGGFVEGIIDLVDSFSELGLVIPVITGFLTVAFTAIAISAVTTAIGGLGTATAGATIKMIAMTIATKLMGAANVIAGGTSTLLAGALNPLTLGLGVAAGLALGLKAAIDALSESESRQIVSIKNNTDTQDLAIDKLREFAKQSGITGKELKAMRDQLKVDKLEAYAKANGIAGEELEELRTQLKNGTLDLVNFEEHGTEMQKVLQAIGKGKFGKKVQEQFKLWRKGVKDSRKPTKEIKDDIDNAKVAISEFGIKLAALSATGIISFGKLKDLQQAGKDVKIAFDELNPSIVNNTEFVDTLSGKIDLIVEAYRILGKDVPPEITKMKTSLDSTKESMVFLTGGTKNQSKAVKDLFDLSNPLYEGMKIKVDSWSGSQSNLNTNIKDTVIDARTMDEKFSEVTTTITTVANAFANIGIGESIFTDIGRLSGVVGGLVTKVSDIDFDFSSLKDAGKSLTGIAGAAGLAVQGFTILKGVFESLFGSHGELEAAERRLTGMTGLTQDWSGEIEELAIQMGGADSAGNAFNELLGRIIESSNITSENFGTFIEKIREVVSAFEDGTATADITAERLGSAFSAILDDAERLGEVGGNEFISLIELVEEFNLTVEEIEEFKEIKFTIGFEGHLALQNILDIDTTTTIAEIEALKESLLGMEAGSDEFIKASDKVGELEASISSVRELQNIFGEEVIAEFQQWEEYQDRVADNSNLITAIGAWGDQIESVTSRRRIDETEFNAWGEKAVLLYEELRSKGFSANEALIQMGPQLETLDMLQNEFKFSIDDTIGSIIEQGKEAGIVSDNYQTESQQMIDGLGGVADRLDDIIYLMSDGMMGALSTVTDGFVTKGKAMGDAIDGVNTGLNTVADTMATTVSDEITSMGNLFYDVTTGHSMITETNNLNDSLLMVADTMDTPVGRSISNMGSSFTGTFNTISNGIGGLMRQGDDLIDLKNTLSEGIEIPSVLGHFDTETQIPGTGVNLPQVGGPGSVGLSGSPGSPASRNVDINLNNNAPNDFELADQIERVLNENINGVADRI